MKISTVFLIIPFFTLSLGAQAQVNSDSLWAVWRDESQPVITRLKAIHAFHEDKDGLPTTINPDTAFYYAQLEYDLAEANGLKEWMAKALFVQGSSYAKKGDFREAAKLFIQSRTIAEEIGHKMLIGRNSGYLGMGYMRQNDAKSALAELSKALKIFEELADKKRLIFILGTLSLYYFQQQDNAQALAYIDRALAIQEELTETTDNENSRWTLSAMQQTRKMIMDKFDVTSDPLIGSTQNPTATEAVSIAANETNDAKMLISPRIDSLAQVYTDKNLDHFLKEIKTSEALGDSYKMADDLTRIAYIYQESGDQDKALTYYFQSLKLLEELGDKYKISDTYFAIGLIYYEKSDYDKALENIFQCLHRSEELEGELNRGAMLSMIGNIYSKRGDIDQALVFLNRSYNHYKATGRISGQASVQNMIAGTYRDFGDHQEALKIYTQNLAYLKKIGDKANTAGTLLNIGNIYEQQGDRERAMENYLVALKVFKEMGSMDNIALIAVTIGNSYLEEGNYALALDYSTQSLAISEKTGKKENAAFAQGQIARIYTAQGNHAKAISTGALALKLAQEMGAMSTVGEVAKQLATSYKATGRYQEALQMNELYMLARDSLKSEENQKAVIQQQVKSNYEKQKAIDDLENEKRVAVETEKKEAQQKLSIAIGIGLLLISLLALVIFNRLKVTRQQKVIIEAQKKKVEQSEKYKEQFLANMSHEIRTPMHAISGMVKILKRNEHLPAQDTFLNAMHTSANNLVIILNDVLDLSKIEAGKLDIESMPMQPAAVLENVVQILKYKAEEKGLTLTGEIADDVPSVLMGDPTRLSQILINLAGNAIKFTEKGSVDISVTRSADQLRFSIKDTGIGIAADKLDSIFVAFQQGKSSTARQYGGTGLGLSISKQLVELQQGKIRVESENGRGSIFYVELPIVAAEADAIGQDLITEDKLKTMAASLKGIRVLLAEDNPFNQLIAQDDLSFYIEDVKIDTVENGALAVEKFKTGEYDLILMDVQMPDMNGFEAAREIRKIEKSAGGGKAIPIIAMTASLLKSEVDSCYAAGMDNYIPKPYKAEELIGTIYEEVKG
ncbi:MAG: hypothetical protein DA408_12920 [Bacteroidetes bacterium]|nr:MAG: hypothetical protein C7N36_06305 [Bacteroidota bacterium]PTM11727.1 MAG: hypothetical protein DA408_12920 [Bacteroidota bacterium]